ncbi:thiamine-phosphate kinase [Candidatus Poribacteria bacterium]
MLIKDIGEFDLIKRMSAGLESTGRPVIAGIGDDSAVLPAAEGTLQLVTTDMLVENVHFRLDFAEPFQIGWRSLAVNISDIAAMGGEPTYAFVSIGLPRETTVEFVDELYSGMQKIATEYSVDIVGGDTVSAPQIVINIALLGEVEAENLLLRSGAKEGDALAITGNLGGSEAGLTILKDDLQLEGIKKHLMPVPRVQEGRLLAKSGYVTSMIDISDGLASETHHICEASGTGAELCMNSIPLSDNVRQVAKNAGRKPYDLALYGGEDYELLFTCQSDKVSFLAENMLKVCGIPLTTVGKIVERSRSITIEDVSGNIISLRPRGYDHFAPATG